MVTLHKRKTEKINKSMKELMNFYYVAWLLVLFFKYIFTSAA